MSDSQVKLVEAEKQRPEFVLLQPRLTPPRTGKFFQRILAEWELSYFFPFIARSSYLVVDFETKGGDVSSEIEVIGIGLAWDTGSCYLPYTEYSMQSHEKIWDLLYTHPRLVAHNVPFDGGVFYKLHGKHPNWYVDTLALYKQIANEGWVGQRHGLKEAMVDVLQWENSNETELDEWLVVNGYYRGTPYRDESPEHLLHMYRTGATSPEKGEMWRAPTHILGKYCILDAEATYLLIVEHLLPVAEEFPALLSYHTEEFMYLIIKHIEQHQWGILMDRDGLQDRAEYLRAEIDRCSREFLCHPDIHPHIRRMEEELLSELASKEPARMKKARVRPPEPPRLTSKGEVSKNYLRWVENADKYKPEISLNWLNWKERWDRAVSGADPDYQFNLNSGPALRRLIYEKLGHPVSIRTETGEPAVGIKALKKLPPPFDLLIERGYHVKELSYIDDYIERTLTRETMHPSFRLPGTSTGRLSSTGPNLQQVPKSKAVMSLFRARPGNVLVDLDFCLHPDTEYLTREGWKVIAELHERDEVWQVDPDSLQGSWVVPSRIIHKHYSGKMYSIGNRRGRLDVTKHHRMLWTNQSRNDRPYSYRITESQEGIPSTYYSTVQTSSNSNIRGYCPTYQELNLVCLLQADSYWDGSRYHVQLSKSNKRKEAVQLLGKEHAVYPPRSKQRLEVAHWWNVTTKSPLLRGKSLWLEELDTVSADALVSCLTTWDGHAGRSGESYYYSTDTVSIDQVQRYLVRCGYECRLTGYQPRYVGSKYLYKLTIRKAKGLRLRKGVDDTTSYDYEGKVGCVTVPTGCILVRSSGQTFITGNCALESMVAAELSEDPNLALLYGNGVPENDVHLFVASRVPGKMGQEVLATGYRPVNPPPGSVSKAKKEVKHIRNLAKTVVYACQYGAGVNRVNATLEADNIFLPIQDVEAVWNAYWNTFSALREYSQSLRREWEERGGYILNGVGRPMCVTQDYVKDLLSRQLQSTGHDLLVKYIYILATELDRRQIPWQPFVINWHDAAAVEVPEKCLEETVEVFKWAVDALNKQVRGLINLKGTPSWGVTLADIKEPES